MHWTIKPIQIDVLNRPLASEAALALAADAHLLLIALRHPLSVPSRLRNWLELWALHRHVQDAALAVWNGANGDTLSPAVAPDLSHFAARHGLSFISDIAGQTEDPCEVSTSDQHEHEVISTPMLQRALRSLYEKAAVNA